MIFSILCVRHLKIGPKYYIIIIQRWEHNKYYRGGAMTPVTPETEFFLKSVKS